MSNGSLFVEVNKDIFAEQIHKRGLIYADVSREVGVSNGYFKNIVGRSGSGRLPMTIVKSLEREFNLRPDDYSLEKNPYTENSPRGTTRKEKKANTEINEVINIDYDRVQKMIDKSVDKAISELKMDYDKLYQTMYGAIYKAVKQAWNEPIEKTNKIESVGSAKRVNGRAV